MQQNQTSTSLPETLAQVWHHSGQLGVSGPILPDGCRDLIVTEVEGDRPAWQVSELFDEPHQTDRITVNRMIGFRLKPGTQVNEPALLAELKGLGSWDEATIYQLLADHTRLNTRVSDALGCIAEEQLSIAASAGALGVTLKTLQRTLARHTSRSPVYWRQLARIRKAARRIEAVESWADFALDNGFSDQAHMSREFQRWFGVSPMQFAANTSFKQQAQSVAFG
ncbi:helix-turn-helix domain-containing protein [Pseudovibrio brasiliensis]|uniref:AraC family transcriptional regulator n=1 Tax=Pseudovibrio brasiliensis TaxID=1898042 RepID=A0ABX8ARA0_9HYPH|nr:helix-turn-helix transcriptional regulator [Pseudovibrio brasiliensis]QUS56221.1 AraC family transcriptional regulator [Pseudovibrio brasiliensis]